MKELSTEEKALRYDEAIINGSRLWESGEITRENYEYIFPELKENEDEKIRKEIIEYLEIKYENPNAVGYDYGKWIAWLEKQGERNPDQRYSILDKLIEADGIYQMAMNDAMVEEARDKAMEALSKLEVSKLLWNLADKTEPKFKVGDTIQPKDRGHEPWQIMQVDMLDKKYRFKDGYVIHFSQEDDYELVEQKPGSEEDELYIEDTLALLSFGCSIHSIGEVQDWLKSLKNRLLTQSKQ